MKTEFSETDHNFRLSDYKPDEFSMACINRMNHLLAEGDDIAVSGIDRPNLFIFGLPRSGTTLLYQLLAYSLDIGYVSNLSARFWLAPRTGTILARAVLGNRRDGSFQSDYGKSLDPAGPHEFAFFWQHWLNMRTVDDAIDFSGSGRNVNWEGLRRTLCGIQDVFDRGLVHKTNYVANVSQGVMRHLQMPFLIYIERDPLAVALSILKARRAYYGTPEVWWATYPPTHGAIRGLPFPEQIARQVQDLRASYRRIMDSLDPACLLRVTYTALCQEPARLVEEIRSRVRTAYGVEIAPGLPSPERFRMAAPAAPATEEEHRVAQALRDLEHDETP